MGSLNLLEKLICIILYVFEKDIIQNILYYVYHRKSSTGCEVEKRDIQENILNIAKAVSTEKICSAK